MKRLMFVALAVLVGAAVTTAGCTQTTQSGQTAGLGNHVVSTASQNNVTVKNYQFDPQSLTIPQGANVTWTNQDSSSGGLYGGSTSIQHQITSDNSSFARSAPLNNGDKYTVQFNQTGTFPYHCAIHTYVTGTITVVARNATTAAT
ncbi:MAG: cupredoxin domain-containing protein [Halobacteriota archaeon]